MSDEFPSDDGREAWLRGPVPDVPPLLQPVAHALVQAREEVRRLVTTLPADLLWTRPSGVASIGFHLQHLSGVTDRLFTYARGESLTSEQLRALKAEGEAGSGQQTAVDLIAAFDVQVDRAMMQLRATDVRSLTEARAVGRAGLPSTVFGLLMHTAEHVQRHVGQLIVTVRVQRPPA